MKSLSVLISVYIADLVSGFAVHQHQSAHRPADFALAATSRQDASALVEEALKITSSYGLGSSEAKLAWETVEDVDSSDTR